MLHQVQEVMIQTQEDQESDLVVQSNFFDRLRIGKGLRSGEHLMDTPGPGHYYNQPGSKPKFA